MRKYILIILAVLLINTCAFASIDNHWAYNDFIRGINNGYVNGYADNKYLPNNHIKYSEFIKLIVKVYNSEILNSNNVWYTSYVNYAIKVDILTKDIGDYNKCITRSEVIELLCNYLRLYNINIVGNNVDFLYKNNILKGYDDSTLRIDNYITRAEAITLMNRIIDYKEQYIYNEINDSIFEKHDLYKYTNYNHENTIFSNTYIVKNNKILYSDTGRYSVYKNEFVPQYNDKVLKLLKVLINKENYVFNIYVKDTNYLYIVYGSKDKYIDNGYSNFEVIINMKDNVVTFKVYRLWKELNELKQGIYNKYYIIKLQKALEVFLLKEDVTSLIECINNDVTSFSCDQCKYKEDNGIINIDIFE